MPSPNACSGYAAVTTREREILSGPIRLAIDSDRGAWDLLKHQINNGPEAMDFPYYPAALDFAAAAKSAVQALSEKDKQDLIAEWKRLPRLVDRSDDDSILAGYAVVVLDQIVERARAAAGRTVH
jgi:hypothetical protein